MIEQDQLIARISKGARAEVRVQLRGFKDKDLIDVRVFAPAKDSVTLVPTSKGISLDISALPELRAALEVAESAARESGLL